MNYEKDISLTIKSSIRKLAWLILLMGSMVFMAVFSIPEKPLLGWIGTIFTLPCFLIALYLYRPSATYLRLTTEGFEAVSAGRRHQAKWRDIIGFHIVEERGNKMIGILYTETYLLQKSTYSISANDSEQAWIQDRYQSSIETTCERLNQWRSTYGVPNVVSDVTAPPYRPELPHFSSEGGA